MDRSADCCNNDPNIKEANHTKIIKIIIWEICKIVSWNKNGAKRIINQYEKDTNDKKSNKAEVIG